MSILGAGARGGAGACNVIQSTYVPNRVIEQTIDLSVSYKPKKHIEGRVIYHLATGNIRLLKRRRFQPRNPNPISDLIPHALGLTICVSDDLCRDG